MLFKGCIVENNSNVTVPVPKTRTGMLDCNCGKGRFAICYDGRMVGCLSYTELYSYPLKDGFQQALEELRRLLSQQKDHCLECTQCAYQDKCSKCPGINYAESGSLKICTDYRRELARFNLL